MNFEHVSIQNPAIDRFLTELRGIYVNGGALLACFTIAGAETPSWFVSRTPSGDKVRFDALLTSPTLGTAFPELDVPDELTIVPAFRWVSSLTLDGELAHMLVRGGAYHEFRSTPRQAKELAGALCEVLIGDRYADVWVCRSEDPWTSWFQDVAWDSTWIIVDNALARVWVLCATDTD